MSERNIRVLLEYDGTEFSGWQRQTQPRPNGTIPRTVQGCIEEAIRTMTGEQTHVQGAGRTDAGVHAEGQVANFRLAGTIPALGLLRGLNSHLPPDIALLSVSDVPEIFDARLSARGKVYRYRIWNHAVRSPLQHRTSWHHRAPLDIHHMREVGQALVGEHDFRGFRAADCDRRTTVRILRRVEIQRTGGLIEIEVEATAFLRNMVRILAGTLMEAGRGEIDVATVARIFETGDRTLAGVTAPPQGLALVRVIY